MQIEFKSKRRSRKRAKSAIVPLLSFIINTSAFRCHGCFIKQMLIDRCLRIACVKVKCVMEKKICQPRKPVSHFIRPTVVNVNVSTNGVRRVLRVKRMELYF